MTRLPDAADAASPFTRFANRVIEGGTVTDADVNEWVHTPWYRRAAAFLSALLTRAALDD